jgi:hypothetical protein
MKYRFWATPGYEKTGQVSRLPEEYPGWMLERQGQYRGEPPVRGK